MADYVTVPRRTDGATAAGVSKQGLAVDQILPLHGRMVPVAEMNKAAGVTP